MPEALVIVLNILLILVGIWLLLFITALIFIFSFHRILNKHTKAMTVTLNIKYENVKKLVDTMKENKVEPNSDLLGKLESINPDIFVDLESEECAKARETLSYLKDELMFLANRNEVLNNRENFIRIKHNILESDNLYRANVAMYNADILGWNYWTRFAPCLPLLCLFRFKKKEIIS